MPVGEGKGESEGEIGEGGGETDGESGAMDRAPRPPFGTRGGGARWRRSAALSESVAQRPRAGRSAAVRPPGAISSSVRSLKLDPPGTPSRPLKSAGQNPPPPPRQRNPPRGHLEGCAI